MRHSSSTLLAALCALLASMSLPLSSASAAGAAPSATEARTARVIVRLRPDSALLRRQAQAAPAGADTAERARALGTRVGRALRSGAAIDERTQVMFADGLSSAQLAAELARQADVESAVVDQRRRRLAVPNDPLYVSASPAGPATGQWYLKPPSNLHVASVDAESAWDVTVGSPTVVVAVLDSGVRFEHPDLRRTTEGGNLLPGYDMIADLKTANDGTGRDADASDPGDWVTQAEINTDPHFADCVEEDSSWHGTQVSGIVGAITNNAVGMASVGRTVRVLPVRVLGKCGGFDSDIIAGMRWAAGLDVPGVPANSTPAKVINLSLGGEGACSASTGYPGVIAELDARGVVVVASAGNGTGRAANVPANCPGAIGVAGVRHVGSKVGFSDLGPEVSVSAPAGNCVNLDVSLPCLFPILTTSNAGATTPAGSIYTDETNFSVGTSFASPLVAGTAALMLSASPGLSRLDLQLLMQQTARPFPTVGAEAGVLECTAPQYDPAGAPLDQEQCYCSTGTCGAGMLDAGAAVRAASSGAAIAAGRARIDLSPVQAVAGSPLQLIGSNSLAPAGRPIVGYQWALVDGGGIVTTIADATQPTATVVPAGSGRFKVRLTVQDLAGGLSSADLTLVVNAASTEPPPPEPVADSGGGGGALGLPWLLLLVAAAVPAFARSRRR